MTRLLALDWLRGLAVGGMLLVNHPASFKAAYAPLRHAPWHGLTLADFVFPVFLFVVGTASSLGSGRHVWRRAGILFCIGLCANAVPWPGWDQLRWMGVLQRIALVYLILTACSRLSWTQCLSLASALALVHTAIHLWGLPGFLPAGFAPYQNPASALDRIVLGGHVWRYSTDGGDPEGLLSTLGACATGLLGMSAGSMLNGRFPFFQSWRSSGFASGADMEGREESARVLRSLRWQAALVPVLLAIAGMAASWFIPVNKTLWSASFVALTGAVAWILLLVFVAIEGRRVQGAEPSSGNCWFCVRTIGEALGRNALGVYVAAIVAERILMALPGWSPGLRLRTDLAAWWLGNSGLGAENASLMWSVAWLFFWSAVALLLHARGIRLRISAGSAKSQPERISASPT